MMRINMVSQLAFDRHVAAKMERPTGKVLGISVRGPDHGEMVKGIKPRDGRRRTNRDRNFARILIRMAALRRFYDLKTEEIARTVAPDS